MRYEVNEAQLVAYADDRHLFTYVFQPEMPRSHAPRPYFHPIRSLTGTVLTGFSPADHPWHYGLSLAVPQIDGVNFWGGGTYVAGEGYLDRADHGSVEHVSWDDAWVERLRWRNGAGSPLIDEVRAIHAHLRDDRSWQLELIFALKNVTDHPLTFASPAVAGRPGAGYGGLFWRGASIMGAWMVQAGGVTGERAVHGISAPSLDWRDPESGTHITFLDLPSNPRFPTRWFVRQHDYPGVCFPLAFDDPLKLDVGATLTLTYAVIIADQEA